MSIEIQKDLENESITKYLDFIFEKINIDGYEIVYKITNSKTNLNAIISIHDLTLGTALGGIRIKNYSSFDEALNDVLRLSKGMTYKSAVAEVGFGGGKSVIMLQPSQKKTQELLLSFGEAVDFLKGKYICAEDMGCTPDDMLTISKKTKYVVGLPTEKSSGNPAKFTAWGVFQGIRATLYKLFGSTSFQGRKIAIQGLGSVGLNLVDFLFWQGADLVVTDVNPEALKTVSSTYGIKAVKPNEIFEQQCDIFSPCAIGGIINDDNISKLKCKAVCGCANNQLLEDRHADILKKKNILYAPDFVVNAGGLLNVSAELDKEGYHPKRPKEKIDKIYDMILEIYNISEKNDISTNQAAIKLAQFKIESGIGKRKDRLYFHYFE
ncbi:MAG: Glu/Leu/Phe/Val dehydrogenase dimerization domain-containing protein [Parachlamydiales bacterium]|jgi:leucine dehydrogenase